MAPSPELGQPKAPDKTAASDQPLTADSSTITAANYHIKLVGEALNTETVGTATSLASNNKNNNSSSSSTANTISTPSNSQNLGKMDDVDLKKLLDEAITYKRPKDREHKSEIFKELLQHAELEDQARADYYINCVSRSNRSSNRHTQGGSLQDLVEAARTPLDTDFPLGGNARRHQHNSRQKKYSSVASRQREGGSLPSNVNCNQLYEDSFLTEYKRKNKLDKVHGSSVGTAGGLDEVAETSPRSVPHTVIEIEPDETRHLLAHDSLAKGILEPLRGFGVESSYATSFGAIEMNPLLKKLPRVAVNYTTPQIVNLDMMIGDASRHSADSIDSTVQFKTLLMNNSKQIDVNPMQLNNSYVAVNSVIDRKATAFTSSAAASSITSAMCHPTSGGSSNGTKFIEQVKIITDSKHIDENGNALQVAQSADNMTSPTGTTTTTSNKPKTKNVNKADRNTKTLKAYEIPGNRGNDDMEKLVAFIENRELNRRNAGKRKTGKLKKSNSMEELKSCSKIEDEVAQSKAKAAASAAKATGTTTEVTVTLRNKHTAATAPKKSTTSGETKENHKQQKRGERRSWGTEELTYLGETNDAPPPQVSNKDEDVGQVKKTNHTTNTPKEPAIISTLTNQASAHKKKGEHSLSIVSIESISTSSETAEFHVVTKKKKVKKRNTLDDNLRPTQKPGSFGGPNTDRRFGYPDPSSIGYTNRGGKYQTSHNNTNDREAYLPHSSFYASHGSGGSGARENHPHQQNHYHPNQNHHQTHQNRRKSTSSVPASEKSDSSDLESVISLPIESTKRLNTTTQTTANNATTKEPTPATPSAGPAQISYADIARISNPDKTQVSPTSVTAVITSNSSGNSILSPNHLEKWPSVSTKTSSPDQSSESTSNMSSCSSVSNKSNGSKQIKTDLTDIPVVASTSDGSASTTTMSSPKPVSYSQLLIDNEHNQKTLPSVLSTPSMSSYASSASTLTSAEEGQSKQTVAATSEPNKADKSLPKSKSVDRDDQYPALIKTVKKNPIFAITDGPTKMTPFLTATILKSSPIPAVVFTSNMTISSVLGETSTKKQNKTSKPVVPAITSTATENPKISKSQGSIEKSGPSKKQIAKKEKQLSNNRPAVVIFSDRGESNNAEDSPKSPPLLFGDFNDEVLRLLEQDSDPSSIQYIPVSRNGDSSITTSTAVAECCCAAAAVPTKAAAQSNLVGIMDEPSTMSFLGNSIDHIMENVAASVIPTPAHTSGGHGKKSKNKHAKNNNETIDQSVSQPPTVSGDGSKSGSSVSTTASHTPSAMHAGGTTGTSVTVAAALEAIALQNKSAVNSMATAKVLTELTVRYVAPPPASYQNRANYNHDKIVNFVGMAWHDILVGGHKFYNDGQ